MAGAARQPVLWADHEHLAKPVLQALPPVHKLGDDVAQAEPKNLSNRLWRRLFHIDSANYVRLARRKRRQEHVEAVAY
jgi:hypothetical protein